MLQILEINGVPGRRDMQIFTHILCSEWFINAKYDSSRLNFTGCKPVSPRPRVGSWEGGIVVGLGFVMQVGGGNGRRMERVRGVRPERENEVEDEDLVG
jgi:hypothetical protein